MIDQRHFGEIDGIPEGSTFINRKALHDSGVHKPLQAGISGSGKGGADSVVLSGGYDDSDRGEIIEYTGEGGKAENSSKHIKDQVLSKGNLGLAISKDNGFPVRVIRGSNLTSKHAPKIGYKYGGLYRVEDWWTDKVDGFKVFRYKLVKIEPLILSEKVPIALKLTGQVSGVTARRQKFQTLRIIRDTKKSLEIKAFYNYSCQICSLRLEGPIGPYAEAAHIKPWGFPHNGPDDQDNLLCLCPNHHILFDMNAFTIADNFDLIGITGKLHVKKGHEINPVYLTYRRKHYSK